MLAACSGPPAPAPLAQVVLHIDTDAPVASDVSAALDWGSPIPLFDQLRVDVYPPGATDPCAQCSTEFSVSAERFASSGVSFGVATGAGEPGWVARVRLTALRYASSAGDVDPDTTIDAYVALPPAGAGQVLDASVMLSADSVGVAASMDAPVAASSGLPSASQVGTWPRAQRTPCTASGSAHPGAVCVPGGAYWMGASSDHLVPGSSPTWRRLVVLSPFWLDASEITVANARAHGLTVSSPWSGSTDGSSDADWCTFTAAPGPRDAMPVNCIDWVDALAACNKLGGTLPTEAQFEYVQGGALGTPYPWGRDAPSCSDAVWGRNGFGIYESLLPDACRTKSNFLGLLGGPDPPARAARDAVALPGGTLVDVAGNLGELVLDAYELREDACWSQPGIRSDPVCIEGNGPPHRIVVRGGSWAVGTSYLEASQRYVLFPNTVYSALGFRCAYPDR